MNPGRSTMKGHGSEARAKTRFVASSMFLLAVGFFLVKVGRDALFIQGQGLFDLPKAYLGIALLAGPAAGLVLAMMRSIGPRATRLVLSGLVSLLLILFSAHIRPGGGLLMIGFFVFVPLVWGVLYSMSWLLAGELLDGASPRQLAESYGLIGGAAIVGGISGGLAAKFLADFLQPNQTLWLAAAVIAASGMVIGWAQLRWPARMAPPGPDKRPTMTQGMASVVRSRFGLLLLGVGMAAGLVGVLLEFQFYLAATGGGEFTRDTTDFFANIYIVLNVSALALQVLVLPRLHKWIGVGGSLLILPLVLVGGAGALVAGVSLLGISSLRVAEGGLKSSLHRPNWEQTYLLLSELDRPVAKMLVDGFGVRVAEGIAGGFLLLWLTRYATVSDVVAGGTNRALALLFIFSLVWLLLTWALRRKIHSHTALDRDAHCFQYGIPLPDC